MILEESRSIDAWQRAHHLVEDALTACLPVVGACPAKLREAMEYSLMAGGKRFRPVLTLLACEACGGNSAKALPAACAVEMVHTYSLIHDDLPAMDDDDLRRGRPTNHRVFGEALAILAGDALLTLAFEQVTKLQSAEVAIACCRELATASGASGMVGGQVADLEAEQQRADIDLYGEQNRLQQIHARKTGAMIAGSAVLGGLVAQASEDAILRLRRFGENLGLAFQITDDLLDIHGSPDKIGKSVGKDVQAGKLTYPALWGAAESRRWAERLVQEACELVEPFGPQGIPLAEMARFVLRRDH